MNWNLTTNSHSIPNRKKEKLKEGRERERREKNRMQSVKWSCNYYPRTDIIRDSEEIAQLCQCRKTTWLVMGNQNQLMRDLYFSTEKLSHNMSQKCERANEKDNKLPVTCETLASWLHCSSISSIFNVLLLILANLLSSILVNPILTSHTLPSLWFN